MGTRRTQVMTSLISILVHFIAVFIFAEAGLSMKIAKIAPSEDMVTHYRTQLQAQSCDVYMHTSASGLILSHCFLNVS